VRCRMSTSEYTSRACTACKPSSWCERGSLSVTQVRCKPPGDIIIHVSSAVFSATGYALTLAFRDVSPSPPHPGIHHKGQSSPSQLCCPTVPGALVQSPPVPKRIRDRPHVTREYIDRR
jgi:hypothetical protein